MKIEHLIESENQFHESLNTYIQKNDQGCLCISVPPLFGHLDLCLSHMAHQKQQAHLVKHILLKKSPYAFPTSADFLEHVCGLIGINHANTKTMQNALAAKQYMQSIREYLQRNEQKVMIWMPYADILYHQQNSLDKNIWQSIGTHLFHMPSLYIIAIIAGLFRWPSAHCKTNWHYTITKQERQYLPLPDKIEKLIYASVQGHPLLCQAAKQYHSDREDIHTQLQKTFDTLSVLYFSQLSRISPQMAHILDASLSEYYAFHSHELARRIHLPNTSLSSQLNRLIKQGYIHLSSTKIPRKYIPTDTLCSLWRQWTFEEHPKPYSSLYWQQELFSMQPEKIKLAWPPVDDLTNTLYEKQNIDAWKAQWLTLQMHIEKAKKSESLPTAAFMNNKNIESSLWIPDNLIEEKSTYRALTHDMNITLLLSELDLHIVKITQSAWIIDRAKQHKQKKKIAISVTSDLERILDDETIEPSVQIFFAFLYAVCHAPMNILTYQKKIQQLLKTHQISGNLHGLCAIQWAQIAIKQGDIDYAIIFLKESTRTEQTETWIDILLLYCALQNEDEISVESIAAQKNIQAIGWPIAYAILEKNKDKKNIESINQTLIAMLQTYPDIPTIEKSYSYHLFTQNGSEAMSYHYAMKAVHKDHTDLRIRWHCALLAYHLNDLESSQKHFQRAYRENPHNLNISISYSLILMMANGNNDNVKLDAPIQILYKNMLKENWGEIENILKNDKNPYSILLYIAQLVYKNESQKNLFKYCIKKMEKILPYIRILINGIEENQTEEFPKQEKEIINNIHQFIKNTRNGILDKLYLEHYSE